MPGGGRGLIWTPYICVVIILCPMESINQSASPSIYIVPSPGEEDLGSTEGELVPPHSLESGQEDISKII